MTRVTKIDANSHRDPPRRLRQTIRRKKPGNLSQGVIYQHENSTTHSVRQTVVLLHTSCPDFAP